MNIKWILPLLLVVLASSCKQTIHDAANEGIEKCQRYSKKSEGLIELFIKVLGLQDREVEELYESSCMAGVLFSAKSADQVNSPYTSEGDFLNDNFCYNFINTCIPDDLDKEACSAGEIVGLVGSDRKQFDTKAARFAHLLSVVNNKIKDIKKDSSLFDDGIQFLGDLAKSPFGWDRESDLKDVKEDLIRKCESGVNYFEDRYLNPPLLYYNE